MPRHPDVTVKLTGKDGNAMSLCARVTKALKRAGYTESADEIPGKMFDCKSYDETLRLFMSYVEVE